MKKKLFIFGIMLSFARADMSSFSSDLTSNHIYYENYTPKSGFLNNLKRFGSGLRDGIRGRKSVKCKFDEGTIKAINLDKEKIIKFINLCKQHNGNTIENESSAKVFGQDFGDNILRSAKETALNALTDDPEKKALTADPETKALTADPEKVKDKDDDSKNSSHEGID